MHNERRQSLPPPPLTTIIIIIIRSKCFVMLVQRIPKWHDSYAIILSPTVIRWHFFCCFCHRGWRDCSWNFASCYGNSAKMPKRYIIRYKSYGGFFVVTFDFTRGYTQNTRLWLLTYQQLEGQMFLFRKCTLSQQCMRQTNQLAVSNCFINLLTKKKPQECIKMAINA